jgi:hypothetical protein
MIARRILRKIQWEAVGVVELEQGLPRDDRPICASDVGNHVVEQMPAFVQRVEEALFLHHCQLLHGASGALDLRIGALHFTDHRISELIEKRTVNAKPNESSVPTGASQDAAQHVSPALVRRKDAVRHHEGDRPQMVRNYADGEIIAARGAIPPA